MVTPIGAPDLDFFTPLNNLLKTFDPNGGLPEYLATLFNRLPSRPFEVYETSDLLPLNPWVLSGLLSVDIDRSFASFLLAMSFSPIESWIVKAARAENQNLTQRLNGLTLASSPA